MGASCFGNRILHRFVVAPSLFQHISLLLFLLSSFFHPHHNFVNIFEFHYFLFLISWTRIYFWMKSKLFFLLFQQNIFFLSLLKIDLRTRQDLKLLFYFTSFQTDVFLSFFFIDLFNCDIIPLSV